MSPLPNRMPLVCFPPPSPFGSAAISAVTRRQTLGPRQLSADYQPQFDGLRALAVLTVMIDHFSDGVPNFPLPDCIHLGATGVRLFLVLSGYFITASPAACPRPNRRRWFARSQGHRLILSAKIPANFACLRSFCGGRANL